MKAWMKFFVLALILLGFAGAGFMYGAKVTGGLEGSVGWIILYIVIILTSVASTMFALCILYELGKMWYQYCSPNISRVSDTYRKFKQWLGRDGL